MQTALLVFLSPSVTENLNDCGKNLYRLSENGAYKLLHVVQKLLISLTAVHRVHKILRCRHVACNHTYPTVGTLSPTLQQFCCTKKEESLRYNRNEGLVGRRKHTTKFGSSDQIVEIRREHDVRTA